MAQAARQVVELDAATFGIMKHRFETHRIDAYERIPVLAEQLRDLKLRVIRDALDEVIKPWKISGTYRPFKPVGCVDCRMTGFMGRMGLYELLSISEAFKDRVNREPSLDALRRQGVSDGMRPLRLAGALRVAEGLTTLEEVLSTTPPLD